MHNISQNVTPHAVPGSPLSRLPPPADAALQDQIEAGEILRQLWRTDRNHPGAAHYLIHAFDYPPLAGKLSGG